MYNHSSLLDQTEISVCDQIVKDSDQIIKFSRIVKVNVSYRVNRKGSIHAVEDTDQISKGSDQVVEDFDQVIKFSLKS